MLETKGSVANSSVSATCITTGSIGCLKMSLAKDDSITSLRLSFPPPVALVRSPKTDVVLYRVLGQMLAEIFADASRDILECTGCPYCHHWKQNRCSHVCFCSVLFYTTCVY